MAVLPPAASFPSAGAGRTTTLLEPGREGERSRAHRCFLCPLCVTVLQPLPSLCSPVPSAQHTFSMCSGLTGEPQPFGGGFSVVQFHLCPVCLVLGSIFSCIRKFTLLRSPINVTSVIRVSFIYQNFIFIGETTQERRSINVMIVVRISVLQQNLIGTRKSTLWRSPISVTSVAKPSIGAHIFRFT